MQDFWYHMDGKKWVSTPFTRTPGPVSRSSSINAKAIRLISWNIDFMAGFAQERMRAALQYLEELISPTDPRIRVDPAALQHY
jgi:tyrosyl-DNA phosphodiesterase 2